ncbi:MAG: hypothetical protein HY710_05575 [Candidatus Latescibacteria bacterium]|nr:hypothetical protein [Candidatus Latescibacterota bacterium]
MPMTETWITDFRPAAAHCPGTKLIPYRLNGREGYMLRWLRTDVPIVPVPSPASGWHEIHLGFWGACGLRLRLSNEPWFRWVESTVRWDGGPDDGEEAFWKVANLSGVAFEMLPSPLERRHDQRLSQIAYLRLVPLTEDEARTRTEKSRPTRTAGAVIDGHEMLGAFCPQTPDEVRGLIAPFIESDFKRLHWGCTCTTMRMVYLSRVGMYLGQDQPIEFLHSEHNRRCARALQKADRDGYDPLHLLIDFAAEHDMELWTDFRIQQDYPLDYAGGFGQDFNSPFAAAHPEWRHVDRHGRVCSHLFSHFHPEWEQYKLDLLAELAGYGPAGIHLNLMCEAGVLWDFAPHAVTEFKKQYGIDPLAHDTLPLEWYQFRCDHLTAFMRRLRLQTDRIAAKLGKSIPIAVQVSGDWTPLTDRERGAIAVSQNFLNGFDLGRWARERLVDIISPSFRREYRPMFLDHLWEELGEGRAYVQLMPSVGQHHNAVFPAGYDWSVYFTDTGAERRDLKPFGELDAWRVLQEAHNLYQQGADAVDVWEMGEAPNRLARWNVLKQIGDHEMLVREFGTRIGPLMGYVTHPLRFACRS